MSRSATPGRLTINEDGIIAEVCKGGRMPHAESIFKAMEKYLLFVPLLSASTFLAEWQLQQPW